MKYTLLSSLAGISFGFGAIFLKLFAGGFSVFYLFMIGVTGFFGFILLQYALKYQKASITSATSAGLSSVVAVFGGMFLGEMLDMTEMIGVVLVIIGSIALIMVRQ